MMGLASKKSTSRTRLLAGAAGAVLVGLATVAAQAESAGDGVETVIVTGTHIQRPNLASYSPVSTVSSDDLQISGVTEIETSLNRLPQFTADANENVSNGSDGTSAVNLRGLGSNRNLVLIDGQRMLPTLAVDLNFVPSSMIERVDVLSGGASAVYGSDAISGVVNFIMNKHLNGVRFDADYSIYQHTNDLSSVRDAMDASGYTKADKFVMDGRKYNFNVAIGSDLANGRGNVSAYIGYRSVSPVTQNTRDYSSCPLSTNDDMKSFYCGGSSNDAYGRFTLLSGPNEGSTFSNAKDGSKSWVSTDNSFLYNYSGANYLQRDDRRINAGAFVNYIINDYAEAYGNFMYMNDHTNSQVAASGIWLGTVFTINCDNPLMSDAQKELLCGSTSSSDNASTLIGYRMANGAPRVNDLRHEDFRFVGGIRGKINDNISYDVSYMTAEMVFNSIYKNDVDQDKAANALQVVDVDGVATCKSVVDGTDTSCVPLDIFSSSGPSAEAYKYIFSNTFAHSTQGLTQISANLSANLGAYGITSPWAKDGLSTAFGFEHRQETLLYQVDELSKANGSSDSDGKISSNEIYGELDFPLVQDKPFVKSLTVNTGYRYSMYDAHSTTSTSDGQNFSTYKVEADYAPGDDVRFRFGYNRAVRAPNISELFTAQGVGNVSAVDPCAGTAPTATLAQCMRTGVTSAEYGKITECPADTCVELYGGNPNLKPEKAKTITAGFVLTPTDLDGLTVSVDYFRIKVDKYISSVDPSVIISQCIETGDDFYCSLFHRDHSAGGILFGTNGYVVSTNVNTGYLKTSGFDLGFNYRLPTDSWGNFDFDMMGTYLIDKITEPLPGLGTYDCKGLFGPTCGEPSPAWRHNFRVSWQLPNHTTTISLGWRYFGRVSLSSNTNNSYLAGTTSIINGHISDYSWFDLAASYAVSEDITLRAGINNILDKTPPAIDYGLLSSFGNGNTYPGVYDPMGRMLFMNISAKL